MSLFVDSYGSSKLNILKKSHSVYVSREISLSKEPKQLFCDQFSWWARTNENKVRAYNWVLSFHVYINYMLPFNNNSSNLGHL